MKQHIVIVDGYSAGNLLAPEFRQRGAETVHVQSTPEIWPILLPTFRVEDYCRNLAFDGDLGRLVDELRPLAPLVVLPGTETGVELADALAEKLGVPGNGTRKSEARREKYLMVEAVRAHGLRAARQLKSASADEIIEWASGSKIVVKPIKSAGTDSVSICTTPEEIRRAVGAIVGTVNKLGLENREALAQEYLNGTEYFLNTVSRRGKHHFTEIWRYQKRSINGHDCVYDRNELVAHDGETAGKLRAYVVGVLDALEIQEGPAHTEVMMTADGPVLVESGARLDGLSVPAVNRACIGYSPVDLTVDAILDEAAFARKTAEPFPILKHGLTVYLTTYEEGAVEAIPGEARLRELSSFFQMRLRVKPGGHVKKTTDYFTAPGFLTLVHENIDVIRNDYESIRGMEKRGELFKVQGAT